MTSSHAEEKGTAKLHIWFKVTYSLASMSVTRTPEKPVTVALPNAYFYPEQFFSIF